jgi:hypothetical protein
MAEEYVVTAAYITPKVRDDAKGGWAHRGFYEGAVIRAENIHPDSLQHHLAGDMLAERDAPAADPEPVAEAPGCRHVLGHRGEACRIRLAQVGHGAERLDRAGR